MKKLISIFYYGFRITCLCLSRIVFFTENKLWRGKISFVNCMSILTSLPENGDRLRFLNYPGNLGRLHFAATFVSRKRFRRTMSKLI